MSGLNYSAKVVMMSVANEVLTMCRRGGELLRKALLVRTSIELHCAVILVGRTSVVLLGRTIIVALLYCCVGGHNERWATMIKDGGSATKSTVTAPPTIEMQVQSNTQFGCK